MACPGTGTNRLSGFSGRGPAAGRRVEAGRPAAGGERCHAVSVCHPPQSNAPLELLCWQAR